MITRKMNRAEEVCEVPQMCSTQKECAECGDPRDNRSGVCRDCYDLWVSGRNVKVLDTLDKDRWSCGCSTRPEGVFYCSAHDGKAVGPLGKYDAGIDLRIIWGDLDNLPGKPIDPAEEARINRYLEIVSRQTADIRAGRPNHN